MGVNSSRQLKFPWDIINGPQLGDLEGLLFRRCAGEVVG